ncbi:MAG: hypothetical protein CVT95_12780, partial [Bacteroidetes bacterium HGW-Bacteroidetes-12]
MVRLVIVSAVSIFLFSCSNSSEKDISVEQPTIEKDTIIDTFEERAAEVEKYSAILFSDSLNTNDEVALKLLNAYEE